MIVYDTNDVFAVLALSPAPLTTTMTAVISAATTTVTTNLGSSYTFFLDITPKNGFNITSGAFYAISLAGCPAF